MYFPRQDEEAEASTPAVWCMQHNIPGHMMGEWSSYDQDEHTEVKKELGNLGLISLMFPFTLVTHS